MVAGNFIQNMKIKILLVIVLCSSVLAAVKPSMVSFNTGVVSPFLLLRSDFSKYDSSCQTLQNMIPLSQGPVMRRPGTYFIKEVKDSSKAVRLIPFEYAKTDAYILEFGDEYIRFFRDGGQIVDSVATETLTAGSIVAHYLFNEISGKVVADDDGGTHPATATVDTSLMTTTGKINGCFDFDIYTVDIADSPNFTFSTGSATDTTFSIAGWVYVDGKDQLQVIASKWQEDIAREWRLSMDASQKLQLHLSDDSEDLSSILIAQYKLNEDAADTVVDDVNGTYQATCTTNTEDIAETGKINGALNFSSLYAAEILDNGIFSFDDTSDELFSITAWIYVTDTAANQTIISKWNTGAGVSREWQFILTATEKLGFYAADQSAGKYANVISNNVLTNGWHYVGIVYDNADTSWTAGTAANFMTLYVDGSAVGSAATTQSGYAGMEDLTGPLILGSIASDGTKEAYFADKIDNITIFDTELAAAIINSLYNSGNGTEVLAVTFPNVVATGTLSVGWHHVACTYDATGGSTAADGMILYVDGIAIAASATNNVSYLAMEDTTVHTRIGGQFSAASATQHVWRDKIDNIAIFSDVLTATEVAAMYDTEPYEIASPYDQTELFDIQYAQSADVMYLTQPDNPPQKLIRTLHNLWDIADANYVTGPFMDENTATTTLSMSAASGTITITANQDIFYSGHVGALWEIRHPRDDAKLSGNFNGASSTSSIDCEGDYSFVTHGTWTGDIYLERSKDDGQVWETVSESFVSSVNDDNMDLSSEETGVGYKYRVTADISSGAVTYNFLVFDHMHTGIIRITSYTNPTEVSATVYTELGATSTTKYWSEGYWSPYNGYPATLAFHEFRLWYGGNTNYPQTLWASKVDDYDNMTDGTDDTDALIYTIPNQNPIQWLISQSYLMIGSLGGAGRMGEQDEAMAPTIQPQYFQQTTDGCQFSQAVMAGDAILYLERGGRKIREFVYQFERDKFVSPDMTVLAEHITGDGIVEMAYQSRPDATLWCVREDGDFPSLTYNRSQEVVGWAHNVTDGDIESVAVIPGPDEDKIWFVVNRTIESETKRYIERMQPRDWGTSQSDCFFVDSGLSWDGGATVVVASATQASPCVITVSTWPTDGDGTNLADGDQVTFVVSTGMTELDGNIYTMDDANVTAKTFSLNNSSDTADIDSTSYTFLSTSGTVQRVENTFTGFSHLAGETVAVLADGVAQSTKIVSSTTTGFTISVWANKVHAGLPYTSILQTMPIVFSGPEGSVAASKKRVSNVGINFLESLGTLYGIEDDTEECFTESTLFTGWKSLGFQHGYSREASIYIEQVDPYPLIIRAIVPTVTISD